MSFPTLGAELPELLTVAEVAVFLRTSPKAIRNRIYRGQLGVVRDQSRVLIPRRALIESLVEVRALSPEGIRR